MIDLSLAYWIIVRSSSDHPILGQAKINY